MEYCIVILFWRCQVIAFWLLYYKSCFESWNVLKNSSGIRGSIRYRVSLRKSDDPVALVGTLLHSTVAHMNWRTEGDKGVEEVEEVEEVSGLNFWTVKKMLTEWPLVLFSNWTGTFLRSLKLMQDSVQVDSPSIMPGRREATEFTVIAVHFHHVLLCFTMFYHVIPVCSNSTGGPADRVAAILLAPFNTSI